MKTHIIFATTAVVAGLMATGAFAQPTVSTAASNPAPAVSPASPLPAPDSIIYVPRLPTPAELSQAAAVQKLSIEKIEQTSSQVTVMYKHADGSITTVAYELLSTATSAAPAAATTTRVVPAPSTTVIYASPSPWYYNYYDPFWSPWYWYGGPPVSLNFGIGYRSFGGFYRGGFDRDDFHGGFRRGGFGGGFHRR